jgi:hypothetical protein
VVLSTIKRAHNKFPNHEKLILDVSKEKSIPRETCTVAR